MDPRIASAKPLGHPGEPPLLHWLVAATSYVGGLVFAYPLMVVTSFATLLALVLIAQFVTVSRRRAIAAGVGIYLTVSSAIVVSLLTGTSQSATGYIVALLWPGWLQYTGFGALYFET